MSLYIILYNKSPFLQLPIFLKKKISILQISYEKIILTLQMFYKRII